MNRRYWCKTCGERVECVVRHEVPVYVHATKGADHGPRPTTRQPEPTRA